MVKQHPFWQGVNDCILIAVAGILAGFAVGMLAHIKALGFFHAVIMSTLVFGGVAQMISLTFSPVGSLPVMVCVVTTLIVCLRFALMGMTLRPHFPQPPTWKTYLSLFMLTDENWALALLKQRKHVYTPSELLAYFLGAGVVFYIAYVLGTVMGYATGYWIHDPKAIGFDFAMLALFLSLLVGMWRGKTDILPWIITAVVSVFAEKYIHGQWYIVIGALIGSLAGIRRGLS